MMQCDNQLLFVVETSAVGAALRALTASGIASATLELRVTYDRVIIEVLAPAAVGRKEADEAIAALASLPTTYGVMVAALRRRAQTGADGRMFERVAVAHWSQSIGGHGLGSDGVRAAA